MKISPDAKRFVQVKGKKCGHIKNIKKTSYIFLMINFNYGCYTV